MPMVRMPGWQEAYDSIASLILGSGPAFVGRLGGSDTDALAAMIDGGFDSPKDARNAALLHLPVVKKYNGYYDKDSIESLYFDYLRVLRNSYLATKSMALVDSKLLTMFFAENLNEVHRLKNVPYERALHVLKAEIDFCAGDWVSYPYTFFQTLMGHHNLFRVFESALGGIKVAVACPFGKTIEANWPKRRNFFKDFDYPDFTLSVLNTPITYDGLPAEMYPHENWFSTLDYLKAQLSKMEFDILLLSCGSYAMPLGIYARDTLGKKAIYVGGVLQLFFGIMGRRYQNPFFMDFIYPENFTFPLERESFFNHILVAEGSAMEAFGAYF